MTRRTELPEGSLASQILDSGDEPRRARSRSQDALASKRDVSPQSPTGLILGLVSRRHRVDIWAGFGVAVVLHAGVFAFAWQQFGQKDAHSDVAEDEPPIEISHVVELDPPEPEPAPEPEPVVEPEPAPEPVVEPEPTVEPEPAPQPAEPTPAEPAPAEPAANQEQPPPSPAEAGQVVTAEPDSPEIADFTDFDITTGTGDSYAGGVTSADGKSKTAVHTDEVDPDGPPNQGLPVNPDKSFARPVGLTVTDWDCPWPTKAQGLSIDEQTVVIKATISADGALASVQVVSDPGYGFGQNATECAHKYADAFEPALDDKGRPYTTSVRIPVTFEQ